MMLCIDNDIIAPQFNLALEEYILKNFTEDVFMLWQNEPSVIIGKNQNIWDEINVGFIEENKIKVVRRFTGGGAVYHDLGNINLTFIEKKAKVDFHKFTRKMQDFLSSIDIPTDADDRHSLTHKGLKISGSAQCIYKDKVMYHATLLFSSDLHNLRSSLKSKPNLSVENKKYVQSKRSPVVNIQECMRNPLTIDEFKKTIINYFFTNNRPYSLDPKDIEAVNKIAEIKYSTDDWNYNKIIK